MNYAPETVRAYYGATIGILLGVLVALLMYFSHSSAGRFDHTHSSALAKSAKPTAGGNDVDSPNGNSVLGTPAPGSGGRLTVGDEAHFDVIYCYLTRDQFSEALDDAQRMEYPDAGLLFIANEVLDDGAREKGDKIFRSKETKSYELGLYKLNRLNLVAQKAKGATRVSLLTRLAMAKWRLDQEFNVTPTEPSRNLDLDVDRLLAAASQAASSINPTMEDDFRWALAAAFPAIFGVLGYVGTRLVDPIIGSFGALVATAVVGGVSQYHKTALKPSSAVSDGSVAEGSADRPTKSVMSSAAN